MIVCRRRADYGRKWKLSAAFNVSQHDRAPLDLFHETLGCGSLRRAGNSGWYWEVNRLSDISGCIVPFFERFPLVGQNEGERLRAVQERGRAVEQACRERHRLRPDHPAPRRDEPRRKETVFGSENPQRLYADPVNELDGMR